MGVTDSHSMRQLYVLPCAAVLGMMISAVILGLQNRNMLLCVEEAETWPRRNTDCDLSAFQRCRPLLLPRQSGFQPSGLRYCPSGSLFSKRPMAPLTDTFRRQSLAFSVMTMLLNAATVATIVLQHRRNKRLPFQQKLLEGPTLAMLLEVGGLGLFLFIASIGIALALAGKNVQALDWMMVLSGIFCFVVSFFLLQT